ncbi:hypothetical protein [Nocardiopsis synnemataformans]|uniref:hypothetical protein n=1 Tax=Nocardiopsis synnemataformans TaxID=61305 RepID=UPI003EBDCDC9
MRNFTLHFQNIQPYTITVAASTFAEARRKADEQLDTACERYADDEARRVLAHHTCMDDPKQGETPVTRYVLEFTEERSTRITIEAADPDEAESEVREYWDSYAAEAEPSGGFVLRLDSVEPEAVWKQRQPDFDQAPF